MKPLRVAAVVLNQTPLDWEGNERRIREALAESRRQQASLVCLPELCLTGYGCEDAFHSIAVQKAAWDMLVRLLPETKGMVVCFGLPVLHQNALFNTVCLVCDGEILGFAAKRYLAGDGIHYEPRWFKGWPAQIKSYLHSAIGTFPIGDLFFECGGIRIGFEICEDAWVASRPGSTLALQGVDIILNPSASHFAFGKLKVRERFVVEGSRAFNASYVYSNLLGNESGRAIYDGGALIASGGSLLARGRRFSYAEVELATAVIDVDATRTQQARSASFRPLIQSELQLEIRHPFVWPEIPPANEEPKIADAWEMSPCLKEEEFARAVALGLFDYMRKSRSQGFVVSLSGGADSAAVVCLVSIMLQLAVADLGWDELRKRLCYIPGIGDLENTGELLPKILTCVYQASANSSETTETAARELAAALGAVFYRFDIANMVTGYTEMVEASLGRKLDWKTDDLALQNIQARVRSPGVWMIANLRNALLLSTSNRSEAAVGYATMDGDTSGGLSPIAGIDKAYLRSWLRWLEQYGPDAVGSIPTLDLINRQAPTAELRPGEEKQTDEDDLMPYPLLDAIEKSAIRDKLAPVEVFQVMRAKFPAYETARLAGWVEKFFRLWCRNQWKRERYAPSFHLDDDNLDPKTWCRFPILSGGFDRELQELRTHVAGLAK